MTKDLWFTQNDHQNLTYVKHTYNEKMARKGCKKVILKVSFISNRTLDLPMVLPSDIIEA